MGAMLTWEVVTKKLQADNEMARVQNMMDSAPMNVMYADTDMIIRYMNPASIKTLKTLEAVLPISVDEVVGQSIDIFHSDPSYQRGLFANPDSSFPREAEIQIGGETLDLVISAIHDASGTYIGAMASFEVITKRLALEEEASRFP